MGLSECPMRRQWQRATAAPDGVHSADQGVARDVRIRLKVGVTARDKPAGRGGHDAVCEDRLTVSGDENNQIARDH